MGPAQMGLGYEVHAAALCRSRCSLGSRNFFTASGQSGDKVGKNDKLRRNCLLLDREFPKLTALAADAQIYFGPRAARDTFHANSPT